MYIKYGKIAETSPYFSPCPTPGMSSYGQIKGKLSMSHSSASVSSSILSSSSSYGSSNQALTLRAIWEFFPFIFRINDNNPGQTTLTILEKVCKERGWKEFGEEDSKSAGGNILGWNLWWRSVVMMHTQTRSLYSWQYTNHIPKAINFCNKEYLASYIRIMEDRFGEIFNFCPATFTLPREHEELENEHRKRSEMTLSEQIKSTAQNIVASNSRSKTTIDNNNDDDGGGGKPKESGDSELVHGTCNNNGTNDQVEEEKEKEKQDGDGIIPNNPRPKKRFKPLWICKPVGKSQGKGIFLIDNLSNLPDHPVTVVQEYISRPLLISNYKFDLRLYVTIVSVSPLTIYAYREGLTRFATDAYDLSTLDKTCSHLTNASLNKLSPGYEMDKNVVGTGCKWTLKKLRGYLKQNGYSDWFLWQRIMSIIVLTILGEVGQQVGIPSTRNNFEFLGYDILVDSNLRPWLLETNLSPGLGGDCEVDEIVKKPMLHELFSLIGLPDGRPYVQVVPASSLTKTSANASNIIDIDVESNTAIQLKSEADVLQIGGEGTGGGTVTPKLSSTGSAMTLDTIKTVTSSENFEQTVERLVEKEKEKVRRSRKISLTKDIISPKLRKRLLDATAIYSQSLSTPLTKSHKVNGRNSMSRSTAFASPSASSMSTSSMPPAASSISNFFSCAFAGGHSDNEAARLNFLASTDWIGSIRQGSRPPSTIPHRPGVGLQRKSWYDAPAKHGDWVRIFPFDFLSFQMTRGHLITDVRAIVESLHEYLHFAENLSRSHPGRSDDFYNAKVRENVHWNKTLWMPPVEKR